MWGPEPGISFQIHYVEGSRAGYSNRTDFALSRMHQSASVAERAAQICAALAACTFFVSGVVYLWLGHLPVTHLDYWVIYDFCLNHTWLESSLHKHLEHLIFFPSFFWLADLRFFHGNQLPLFLAGLSLLFLTVMLLLVPVWRDETVGLTAKITASLVIVVGNFWMARSPIIASGGFSVIYSLVMVGALIAVLALPKMCVNSTSVWPATVIVVCAGFLASFSFGTGLAIWPTLLVLAWCLRLPWRSFVLLAIAAVAATVIYQQIPPHLASYRTVQATWFDGLTLVVRLCRLAGSPFLHAASGWHEKPLSVEAARASLSSLWCGAMGLTLAVIVMAFTISRRDLTKSSLKFMGVALVTFSVVAMIIVVAGNVVRGSRFEWEIMPRYLFWSTLFWTGLLLIVIQYADSRPWLHWPAWIVAFALPVLAFPQHYRSGLNARWVRTAHEYAAVSLVNGVHDERQVRMLGGDPSRIYRVAKQLRARRLDMFADGLQDRIGLAETNLFGGRRKREKLQGQAAVTAMVQCDDGAPAARVIGHITKERYVARFERWAIAPILWLVGQEIKKEYIAPKTLVILDQTGVVRGVARSSSTSPFINRAFYLGKAQTNAFVGYIRDYNPQLRYTVRSADDRAISEEEIPVSIR